MPKDWVGCYRSITHPAGRRLGAMLTAMPASSDRACAAPCCDFCTIGDLVADVGLPALVPERRLDGKMDCPAGYRPAGFAGRRPLPAVV